MSVNLALDTGAGTLHLRAEACSHVAWQVEVHQAVGGANLNLGVGVAGGFDQRIEAVLCPDVDEGFDRFDPDVEVRLFEQGLKLGNGVRPAFGQLPYVFRTRDLGGKELQQQEERKQNDWAMTSTNPLSDKLEFDPARHEAGFKSHIE